MCFSFYTISIIARSQRVVFIAVLFLFGAMVAAFWIFPYLELRQVSIAPRPGRSTALYNDYWYALGLFMNKIMVIPQNPSHWLMKEKQYMSILLMPGLLLGIYALIRERGQATYFYLALIIYVVLHFLKLYGFEPLQFINKVPILRDIRFEKYIGLYTLGICILSAYGYQVFFVKKAATKRNFMPVLGACFVSASAVFFYANHVKAENQLLTIAYVAFALFPVLIYIYLLIARHPGYVSIVGVVTGTLLLNLYLGTDTRFDKRKDLFSSNPLYEKARALSDTGRIFPMAGRAARIWSAYGVNDVRNISVVHTRRYHKFFKQFVEGKQHCWHNFVLCSKHPEAISLNALRWLGVDLLVIAGSQYARLEENPDKDWEVVGNYDGYLYVKLHTVDPLISIASSIVHVDSAEMESKLPEWLESGKRPVLIEGFVSEGNQLEENVKLNIDNYDYEKGGEIEIFLELPAYLLIKRQFYPGWTAKISGEQVPILRADYLFQAIQIPPGHSTVEFAYTPVSLKIGVLVSLVGIFVLIGVSGRIRRRKYKG